MRSRKSCDCGSGAEHEPQNCPGLEATPGWDADFVGQVEELASQGKLVEELEYELANDLKSFGKGFTVLEKSLVEGISKEEKVCSGRVLLRALSVCLQEHFLWAPLPRVVGACDKGDAGLPLWRPAFCFCRGGRYVTCGWERLSV
jgi:hypothetical protein